MADNTITMQAGPKATQHFEGTPLEGGKWVVAEAKATSETRPSDAASETDTQRVAQSLENASNGLNNIVSGRGPHRA